MKWTLLRLAQHLWNAPNSLLGLIGALGGRFRLRRDDGVCEVVGGWLIALLTHQNWAGAITLGDVVIYSDPVMPALCREHELVHVRQGRLWGPLFLPAYLLESAYQWFKTGHGYINNRFERMASEKDGR